MSVGLIITNLLEKHEISQKEFALTLGVAESTVSMWKQQKRNPDLDMIKKIALYFGVSTDFLLSMPQKKCSDATTQELNNIDEKTRNIISAFMKLNDDNKDIAIGEVKKILRDQRREYALLENSKKKAE